MKYKKNPLGLNAKMSADHYYHKKSNKTCKACVNIRLKAQNEILPCPNCDLYTLYRSRQDGISSELEVYIYCSACGIHFGVTTNW